MRRWSHMPLMVAVGALLTGACGEHDRELRTIQQAVRPTEGEGFIGNGYGDVPVSSFPSAGGHFRVWWAESGVHRPPARDEDPEDGVPDYVETVADTADRVGERMLELGFGLPLPDDEYNDGGDYGGDGRYDIYLVDTNGGDGYTVTEGCVDVGVVRCSGYMVIENDFFGYGYPSVEQAIEVLVSHEYVHAVQNGYNADVPSWWSEGAATWFEEAFNPEQDDFERLASYYFTEPGRSLNSRTRGPADGYVYGTSLFVYFVSEAVAAEAVAGIFHRTADSDDLERHIDDELTSRGLTLSEAFRQFSVWNLFTGERAVDGVGYPVAADLPEMPLLELDGSQALNWDVELGSLAASYAKLSFHAPITLELRPIEGWTNTLGAAFVEAEDFATSGAFFALEAGEPVRLETADSPVFVLLTNGDAENRGAARLAVRLAVEEPETPTEPEPGPATQNATGADEGCSVTGRPASPSALLLLVAGVALAGLVRRTRARTP